MNVAKLFEALRNGATIGLARTSEFNGSSSLNRDGLTDRQGSAGPRSFSSASSLSKLDLRLRDEAGGVSTGAVLRSVPGGQRM